MVGRPSGSSTEQPPRKKTRQSQAPPAQCTCFVCDAPLEEQFVLSVDFSLVDVCELCYLCDSIRAFCFDLRCPTIMRAGVAEELRVLLQRLRRIVQSATE